QRAELGLVLVFFQLLGQMFHPCFLRRGEVVVARQQRIDVLPFGGGALAAGLLHAFITAALLSAELLRLGLALDGTIGDVGAGLSQLLDAAEAVMGGAVLLRLLPAQAGGLYQQLPDRALF